MKTLDQILLVIKNGNRQEVKSAQKEIEHYCHELKHPISHNEKKKLEIFITEIKKFKSIKNLDNQMYFINTLKWPFMLIGDRYFEFFNEFILEQIQNKSGKIRQAIIKASDWLIIANIFNLSERSANKLPENLQKAREIFCRFVYCVEVLIEKYHEPRFNRYKYISSLPPSIYKSLQIFRSEALLRNDYYKNIYKTWLKNNAISKETDQRAKNSIPFDKIFQIKVTLKNTKPPIWRRVIVPENYSLYDLHKVIQICFDWFDYHLHEFEISGDRFALPDPENDPIFGSKIDERGVELSNLFARDIKVFNYNYDFGGGWEHRIEIEKVLPTEKNKYYPICIAGKNAAPFEDSGGPWGYYEKIEIINNPAHEEHDEIVEWAGFESPDEFNPEFVDFESVNEGLKVIKDYEDRYDSGY